MVFRGPDTRADALATTPAPLDRVRAVTATTATSEIPAARCCRIDRLISVARVAETFGRMIVSRAFSAAEQTAQVPESTGIYRAALV